MNVAEFNVVEFIKDLSIQGVELWVDGEKLRYRGNKEVLTPEVFSELKQHKAKILQLLKESTESFKVYPLSHNQRSLYFLNQAAPESSAYNAAFTARICSTVDVPALQRTFGALLKRHSGLSVNFGQRNGILIQEVNQHQEVCFEEIDASTWNWDELTQKVVEAYQRPFDLETDSLLRVSLFTRSEQDYILLITVHHIACDGWSIWLLMDDLRVLYPAHKNGTEAALTPFDASYSNYVHWQAKMLAGAEGKQLEDYWHKQLSGDLPALNLSTDRTRPPKQTYNGASHIFKLSKELTAKLRKLTKDEGVTLYTTLLAAFDVLLHRYTGQEDILVGSPMAGRNQTESAGLVGDFASPVVLRADLSGNPTFKALLSQVRTTVLEAIAHQDYPFPLIVERLQPNRDPSRSPIFQVLFVLQQFGTLKQFGDLVKLLVPGETEVQVDWGELLLEPFAIGQMEGQFDLTVEMLEAPESLVASFKYNTDLFEAATIQRMAGHFETLLEAIVAHPEQPIAQLSLLTAAERQQMLVEWNDTQTEYPHDKCIHHIIEAQVEQTPDAVAVVFQDQQLTYRELDCRANQLAHHLRGLFGKVKPSLGSAAEVLVGICVERSLEMVVGLLGILKAGGAYVPLDPAYPQDRLAYMLSDSQVPVLLTQKSLVAGLPEHQAHLVCLDSDWELISQEPEQNPVFEVKPENLAYVIYTSGSTGKPKGVLVPHQGLCNLAQAQISSFEVRSDSRVLQFASFSFDASISEVVMTLCCGARLYLEQKRALLPGPDLVELFRKHKISHVTLPPSALAVLPKEDLPDLRGIVVAGEACSPDLVKQWSQNRNFYNGYGPTEATVCATISKCKCTDSDRPPPIGRPIANAQIYLLDRYLQPVPIGVPGELHIGGAGIVRGYLNRPKLTEEKFIPNPFSNQPGARLYKSGDLARYLPDGNIEFLGRIDHQVKIRGHRIEMGEIEAVLVQHPAVEDAIVITTEDTSGNKSLAAFCVSHQEQDLTSELRNSLKKKLPDYMVPSYLVMLEAFPLTPNGKVDRRALLQFLAKSSQQRSGEPIIAPRDEFEIGLQNIWQKLLGKESISVKDNFFELGGHSLLGVSLFNDIEHQFDKKLPVSTLFEAPTIEQLADRLRPSEQAKTWDSLVPIKPNGSKPPLFLIHDANGETVLYLQLASSLAREQPVYALRPHGNEECPMLHTRIKDMVAHYIDKIRSVQPEGPYMIGGLCSGGILSFEIAVQLQAQGQKVALVALMDSIDIETPLDIDKKLNKARWQRFVQAILGRSTAQENQEEFPVDSPPASPPPVALDTGKSKLNQLFERFGQAAQKLSNLITYEIDIRMLKTRNHFMVKRYRYHLDNHLPVPESLGELSMRFIYEFAEAEYVPKQVYQGELTLLRATEGEGDQRPGIKYTSDPLLGWGKRSTKGVKVYDIPGDHSSMLQAPNVKVMAENLNAYIDAALAERP
ncbi:MAG: amino acid adenylation domain-containing protein [Symploca sp. SIO2E6]|nr:amino acid adenylation domain-containing protein [Symploca sp. SIO2E6]